MIVATYIPPCPSDYATGLVQSGGYWRTISAKTSTSVLSSVKGELCL